MEKVVGIHVYAMMPGKDVKLGIAQSSWGWLGLIRAAVEMGAIGVSQHGDGTRGVASGEMGFNEYEINANMERLW